MSIGRDPGSTATSRRRAPIVVGAALLLAGVLQAFGANPATSQVATVVARHADRGPGLDPAAGVWKRIPAVEVPLTAQQTTYPFSGGSVPAVEARAIYDAKSLFVRVEWDDPWLDDRTGRAEDFSDAAAIELPASAGSSVPSVCMGQADNGVNIWQWRADSQAGVPQSATDLGNAAPDIAPPPDEDVHFPARAAGNPYALTDVGAVQNLLAKGFGTIGPAPEQVVTGRGAHENGRWAVVFERSLADPGSGQPAFDVGATTDVAFAVWDGHNDDRNGKKSVSQFVTLELGAGGVPESRPVGLWIGASLVAVLGVGWLLLGSTRSGPAPPEESGEA